MTLKFTVYWQSLTLEAKERLAERAFSSVGYMNHLASGVRIPSDRMKWIIKEITGSDMEFAKKKRVQKKREAKNA